MRKAFLDHIFYTIYVYDLDVHFPGYLYYPPVFFYIAMENDPFIDDVPIKTCI